MTRQARIAPVAGLCLTIVAAIIPYALYAQITAERLVRANDEPHNWLTYSGSYSSRRHSALRQIDPSNVKNLELKWIHQMGVVQSVSYDAHCGRRCHVRHTPAKRRACDGRPDGAGLLAVLLYAEAGNPVLPRSSQSGPRDPRRHAVHGDARRAADRDRQEERQASMENAGSRSERVLLPEPRASGRQGHGHRGSLRRRSRDSGIHRRL